MDEFIKQTDRFDDSISDFRDIIDKNILSETFNSASNHLDGFTYKDVDESLEDNPSLLDYGEYSEILYLKKIQEDLGLCMTTVQGGDFQHLEDLVENIQIDVAHLKNPKIFQTHFEELYSVTDVLVSMAMDFEKYKEKTIIETNIIQGVNDELMRYFAQNPHALYNVDPRLFEEIIAEIFRKFGFETNLTKQTRDGGYDIFAIEQLEYANNKYIIECKRYAKHRKIDINLVRNLYGVKMHNWVTKAFLVTTSSFSADAMEFKRQHAWEIELKDYHDIRNWLQLHWLKS